MRSAASSRCAAIWSMYRFAFSRRCVASEVHRLSCCTVMNTTFNRREFVQTSAGVLAAHLSPTLFTQPKQPLRLGLIIGIGKDPEAAIAKVRDLGLPTCQVYVEDFAQGLSTRLLRALGKHQIEATSVVVGGPGREVWDFYRSEERRVGKECRSRWSPY